MSNNFVDRISPSVRIYSLIFLSLTLFLAHSIYLILFITTLTFILFIVTEEKVKKSVNTLKKIVILLLIFLSIYIIIFRKYDILSLFAYSYKLIIIAMLTKVLFLNMDFCSMHQGVYGIVKTVVSGTFGIVYEIGDELLYTIVPSVSNSAALNPNEELTVIF